MRSKRLGALGGLRRRRREQRGSPLAATRGPTPQAAEASASHPPQTTPLPSAAAAHPPPPMLAPAIACLDPHNPKGNPPNASRCSSPSIGLWLPAAAAAAAPPWGCGWRGWQVGATMSAPFRGPTHLSRRTAARTQACRPGGMYLTRARTRIARAHVLCGVRCAAQLPTASRRPAMLCGAAGGTYPKASAGPAPSQRRCLPSTISRFA